MLSMDMSITSVFVFERSARTPITKVGKNNALTNNASIPGTTMAAQCGIPLSHLATAHDSATVCTSHRTVLGRAAMGLHESLTQHENGPSTNAQQVFTHVVTLLSREPELRLTLLLEALGARCRLGDDEWI